MKSIITLTLLSGLGYVFTFAVSPPSFAGGAAPGGNSGITVTTPLTTPLVIPASPLVSPAIQVILNQTATQSFGGLTPSLAAVISSAPTINLTVPSDPITVSSNASPTQPDTTFTPLAAGQLAEVQVLGGQGLTVSSTNATVQVQPILTTDTGLGTTTVGVVLITGDEFSLELSGTIQQVANATAFIVAAATGGASQDQVQVGASIALTGANFALVADLLNSVSGLFQVATDQSVTPTLQLIAVTQTKAELISENVTVDPLRLNSAILTYNQILDVSDDATVIALSQNADFLEIGDILRRLRAALN